MFSNFSIKNKIISIITIISSFAILVGEFIDIGIEVWEKQEDLLKKSTLEGKLIGEYCIMPFEFNSPERANLVLDKLQQLPYVKAAILYDKKKTVFASYIAEGFEINDFQIRDENFWEDDLLYVYIPIEYNNEFYGTINLRVENEVWQLVLRNIYTSFILLALMLLVIFLLAYRFEAFISKPILKLADFTNRIAKTKDYSVRIEKIANDEIGLLYERYNNMLDNLQRWENLRDEAVKALAESERKFRAIIDNAGSAIFMKDKEGKFLLVNKMTETVIGKSSKQILGKKDHDLFSAEIAEQFAEHDKKVWKSGSSISVEELVVRDNESYTFFSVKFPLKNAYDEIFAVCGISTDITEKKKTEVILQKWGNAFRNAEWGIAISDREGQMYEMMNPAYAHMHGYEQDELKGQSIAMLFPDSHVHEMILAKTMAHQHGHYAIETYHKRKDGSVFPVLLDLTAVKDEMGDILYSIANVQDITDRKIVELELEKHRDNLEDLVRERTQELKNTNEALQYAKDAAETANRAKSEFLANMSHELRTPLNAILGYAQILKQEELNSKHRKAVNTIAQSGEHLLMMINDVLDLSKIEARKMELIKTDFHLQNFLEAIFDIVSIRAKQKGLEFKMNISDDLPIAANGDEKRLKQILLNLLNNAVKFTNEGSITFSVEKIAPDRIMFGVADTGVGIPENMQEEIFESFHQIGELKDRAEGTGLGLAISKALVTMMGGKLNLLSEENKGSLFWFDVELLEAQEFNVSAAVSRFEKIKGYEGKRIHILIADDNINNRGVLLDLLNPLGFILKEAENGKMAIEVAEHEEIDLVLMDIIMPVMDGLEATQIIKRKYPDLPVIAISASVNDDVVTDAAKHGCDVFVSKPVNVDKLINAFDETLHLNWVFKEDAPQNEISRQKTITFPSDETLDQVKKAAKLGKISKLKRFLNEIKTEEKYLPFANHLEQYLDAYDFDAICSLIENKDN